MLEARRPLQRSDLRFDRFRAAALIALNEAAYAIGPWLDLPLPCKLAALITQAGRLVRRLAPGRRLERVLALVGAASADFGRAVVGVLAMSHRLTTRCVRALASRQMPAKRANRGCGAPKGRFTGPIRTSRFRGALAGCA
jgi:hypothetical protein